MCKLFFFLWSSNLISLWFIWLWIMINWRYNWPYQLETYILICTRVTFFSLALAQPQINVIHSNNCFSFCECAFIWIFYNVQVALIETYIPNGFLKVENDTFFSQPFSIGKERCDYSWIHKYCLSFCAP